MKTSYHHDESFRSRAAQLSGAGYTALAEMAHTIARHTARRFSRYALDGVNPTHVQDAAQDALGDFGAKFPRPCFSPRLLIGPRRRATGRFLRRAAARSLRATTRQGMRGDDTAGQPRFTGLTVLDAFSAARPDWLPVEVCAVARKAALKLIWKLSRVHDDAPQLKLRRAGARRRFRVCARILHGLPLADAITGEYAHAERWFHAMTRSGLMAKLETVWPGITASLQGIKGHDYPRRQTAKGATR